MDKYKIIDIVEAQMKAADEAGENWAEYLDGTFGGYEFFCDREVPGFENGRYIATVKFGGEVADIWVNGDSYSVDVR